MEHIYLEVAFLTIIGIVLISKALQDKFRIPLPHSFIVLSFLIYHFAPFLLGIKAKENFDQILFFTIPIILAFDAIHLKWKYIKEYYWSIGYLAVVSVAISIAIGSSLYYFQILGPGMTIGMYVALFSIVMATDAISVSNIFSQFNVPHNIKVLTEGESLGNDATAMIAFFFVGLPWIANGSFDLTTIPFIAVKVFVLSGILGLIVGYAGYVLMKMFHDVKEETLITIAVAYGSFVLAEVFHLAGIFSLIVAIVLFKTLVDKEIENEIDELSTDIKENSKNLKRFKIMRSAVTTKTRHENTLMNIENYGYIAVVVVFVSLAGMINTEHLLKYWKEILIIFGVTTIIRALVTAKFVLIGKNVKAIDYVGFYGWIILTLAGMKGALSLVMVHALPKNFVFLEMFEAITVGVILLSIFVYGFILLAFMIKQEKVLNLDSI
jgi:CPA1 family monovalent cation:H+ antiporter